ncbi:MAG: MFS transporter, partial [Thermomicrobiaceae bacterium]|nr:MFS transporter [Thermomicrobiaceae bacterium]
MMSRRLDSFRLLGNRRFAALWASDLISTLGDRVHRVALATLVYQLTGSLTETGIAFVATALPDLLLGLVAGVYVDRWDRRRTLVLCDLLRVPLVVAIPFVANVSLALVYLILFVLNSLSVVFRPAKTATIPAVVEADDLNAANALSSVSENVSDIVGYPLAGALLGTIAAIAGERAGLTLAFGFDALTYLLSALLILTV